MSQDTSRGEAIDPVDALAAVAKHGIGEESLDDQDTSVGANGSNSSCEPTRHISGLSSPSSSFEARRESRARRSRKCHQVWLHIYDIDAITARLNEAVLRSVNLGAFHCGVEVLGDEWFFAWGETDDSGIHWNEPRVHQVHLYRESVCMGPTPLSEEEIRHVIANAMDTWLANSYHPINRNCVNFAEDLIEKLRVAATFPVWVRGAADAGNTPLLFPIADWAWRWVKWWCTECPEASGAEGNLWASSGCMAEASPEPETVQR